MFELEVTVVPLAYHESDDLPLARNQGLPLFKFAAFIQKMLDCNRADGNVRYGDGTLAMREPYTQSVCRGDQMSFT